MSVSHTKKEDRLRAALQDLQLSNEKGAEAALLLKILDAILTMLNLFIPSAPVLTRSQNSPSVILPVETENLDWRRIATCYDKLAAHFAAAVALAAAIIWWI